MVRQPVMFTGNVNVLMARVSLQGIYKIYPGDHGKEVTAVEDFNLEIGDGEFVVFVGPSGCGKSTTLRMIAGLEEISRGEVSIDGMRVNDTPPKDRDIAMVFQNYALYPHMSVYDNLAFSLKLRHLPKVEIDRRVQEASALLGISEYLQRKPKALSGGQRQRVALGRAIVRQPKVFLFDEPLSNLDAKMRVQMRSEIIKLHQRLRATMIYVTHDQVEAMTMGDRIVVMKNGVIQQIDKPLALYKNPANLFVASFLGTPPMNFIHGTLAAIPGGVRFQANDNAVCTCEFPAEANATPYVGKPVVLGIRPEDLKPNFEPQTGGVAGFRAVIELVEPMGAETHIHFRSGAHTLVVRVERHIEHDHVGREAFLQMGAAKARLFDPETTARIQ